MDDIRSWWEVPCIAHFCHIFQKPLKLPEFEIEELEDALLLDYNPSPSSLLVQLFCNLLNGIVDRTIIEENWTFFLKLHLEWRCEYLGEKWNPMQGDKEYKDLPIRERVEILHRLCHWRMELDDIADLLRGVDGSTLRVEALGRDTEGFTYWYFYGTRLYKEAPKTKPRRKKKDEVTLTPTPGKKGRGKGGGKTPGTPTPGRRRKGHKQEEEEEEEGVGTPGRKGRGQRSKGGESTPGTGRRTRGQRGKEEEGEADKQATSEEKDEESPLPDINDAGSTAANSEETTTNNGDADTPGSSTANVVVNGTPPPDTGWSVVCSTQEEWEELIDSLQGSRQLEPRRLHHTLAELLPGIEDLLQMREKQFRLKLLAEMPRRTSDRIALKAAQKLEQERLEALERESQREEMRRELAEEVRKRDQEAEEKRQRKLEEAMRKRKVREEEQERVRKEEEENWSKALSGELSGPRAAALGAAESVSANVEGEVPEFLAFEEDKDEDMYTAMFKILNGLRRSEDGWVFEDPVTEAIAPGYFDVIEKPMDFCTVEKKLEGSQYKAKQEFMGDMELIFDNCCEYNGEGSEYYEVAEEMRKSFKQLMKLHFTGEQEPVVRRKRRESRSPSACKTPELTSESSSDESDSGSDQSFEVGRPSRPKGKILKLPPDLEKKFTPQMMHQVGPPSRPMFPPPHVQQPPPVYYQYMRQMQHAQLGQPMPPDMMYRHPYPPPRMPPPYPGHHFPPMQEGPPNMYPGYPPPGPPYLPPYRVPPYPPHPMHSHMMHYPRAMPPGMVHHHRHQGVQQSPSPSLAPRQSHSPSTASGSPVAVKPQLPAAMSPVRPSSRVSGGGRDSDGEPALREEEGGKATSPSTPGAQPAAAQGERKEGEPRPAQEEKGEGQAAPTKEEGEEGQPTPKGEREGDGQPLPTQGAKGEGQPTPSRGERGERQPPLPGYGHPSVAYDAGRQAAYRYHMAAMQQHHQSSHDAYPHPPHPHGYPHPAHPSHPHGYPHPPHPHSYSHPPHPHGYDHSPGYQPQSREEAYYAWQQHQQAMYGGRGEVPGGYPPEVMQQIYWQEMERRRRHHYAMLQQQEKRRREQGVPPGGGGGGRKPSSAMEDIPDYQDSLRKYALGLVENREEEREHSEVEKNEEEEHSGVRKEEEGRSGVKDEEEGRSGVRKEEEGRSEVKNEEEGRSGVKDEEDGHSGVENVEGEQCSGVEKEEKQDQHTGVEKHRRKEDEKEGGKGVSDEQKEAGKDTLLPEKAHPSSRLHPKHPHPQLHRPPDHYPPHMMHSSLQNGFPSEADMARMHSHYPPPPPHMYPPPPYGPRHFDPQHRNGVPPAPSHHPAYASYYAHHQRMSYYPPNPYMQEHGAMSPEHMDHWRAEEMKRQQLAAMHGYRSPYPPPTMHQHPQAPHPQPHSQKHALQSPPEDGTEPAPKKQRTSES